MLKSKLKFLFRPREIDPTTTYDYALRLVRSVIGFTVLAVGIIMIVTPGPAIVVIPLGLMILATEYAWARKYLKQFKDGGEKLGAILFSRKKKHSTCAGDGAEPSSAEKYEQEKPR